MLEKLALGSSASKLFREIMREDPSVGWSQLASLLLTEYPEISPAAAISIRRWLNAIDARDFPDEQIDNLIAYFLKDSGYV